MSDSDTLPTTYSRWLLVIIMACCEGSMVARCKGTYSGRWWPVASENVGLW